MQKPLIYFVRPKQIKVLSDTLERVASAGIPAVLLAPQMGEFDISQAADTAKVKNILKQLGLKAPACHGLFFTIYDLCAPDESQLEEMLSAHKRLIANARELGAETYVVHPGRRLDDNHTDGFLWGRARKTLERLLPFAQEQHITIAVENDNPGTLGENTGELVKMVREINSPALGLCFDSGHAHQCGDAVEIFSLMSPFCVTTHLHDNDGTGDAHMIPGLGTIDWARLIPVIKACASLRHYETETFNEEGWDHGKLYRHYLKMLS